MLVCAGVALVVVVVVDVVANGSTLSSMCMCCVSSVWYVGCCATSEKKCVACRCVGVVDDMGVLMKSGQSECSTAATTVVLVNAANTRV